MKCSKSSSSSGRNGNSAENSHGSKVQLDAIENSELFEWSCTEIKFNMPSVLLFSQTKLEIDKSRYRVDRCLSPLTCRKFAVRNRIWNEGGKTLVFVVKMDYRLDWGIDPAVLP